MFFNIEIIALSLVILILMLFYRLIVGPTVIDRILALNLIGTKTTVLILVIGLLYSRLDMFVDIAIAYALLNFITSLAASSYIRKKGKIV